MRSEMLRALPRVRLLVAVASLVALLAGCATVRPVLEGPKGFAPYREVTSFRAVSPEGVVLRVRLVANDPPQTLEFWTEALKTQLAGSGYAAVREESVETRTGKASLLEWAAPVGEESWIYLTGVAVTPQGIALIEAAGVYASYEKHRAEIIESLRTLEVQ
jgi:hypothetical protein